MSSNKNSSKVGEKRRKEQAGNKNQDGSSSSKKKVVEIADLDTEGEGADKVKLGPRKKLLKKKDPRMSSSSKSNMTKVVDIADLDTENEGDDQIELESRKKLLKKRGKASSSSKSHLTKKVASIMELDTESESDEVKELRRRREKVQNFIKKRKASANTSNLTNSAEYTFDTDSDSDSPELGSRERLQKLFKKGKSSSSASTLTKDELKQAEQDMQKFLGITSNSSKSQNGKKDLSKATSTSDGTRTVSRNGTTSNGHSKLLEETNKFILSLDEEVKRNNMKEMPSLSSSSTIPSSSQMVTGPRARRLPKRNTRAVKSRQANGIQHPNLPTDEIVISDSDEETQYGAKPYNTEKPTCSHTASSLDVHTISDSEVEEVEEKSLGKMLLFQAERQCEKIPLRMYELQHVRELRAVVAEKVKEDAEIIHMYLGAYNSLEDDKTLVESGVHNLCTVEIYVIRKSEKELYGEGSSSILKFKLQTADRRGRQDAFVYVHRKGAMQSAINQYAEELGMSTAGMQLRFDGDLIDLKATPESCELEGEECLDLIMPTI